MSHIKFIILFAAMSAGMSAREIETADSLSRQLSEITVNADQKTTRLEGSTLITTVAGTPLSQSGNAIDVLAGIPMISVGTDDSVSVRGKGSPLIMIDNRPMTDGFDLKTLRSVNIRRVELIMAPGAEYDASVSAVIKIATKRDFIDGLSVVNIAEGKVSRVVSGYDNLSLRYFFRNGVELFASGNFGRYNNLVKGSTDNRLIYDGHPASVGSTMESESPADNGGFRAGINFHKGERSAGGFYRMLRENGRFVNHGTEWIDDTQPIDRSIYRDISALNHYGQIYYDNLFAGKYNLHFDGTAIIKKSDSDCSTVYPMAQTDDVKSSQRRDSKMFAGRLTLSFRALSGDITAGTEDSHTSSSLDYRMLNSDIENYIPSSLTDIRQTSLAAFAGYSTRIARWDISAGLRYQFKDINCLLDGIKDRNLSRTDHTVTPDLSIGYTFGDDSSITFSYRNFTEQPSYARLTDGLTYTGMHEIEGGNPSLRDGRSDQFQLMSMTGDFIFQATVRRSRDTYGFIKRIYPADDLQLLFQPVNIDVTSAWFYAVWEKKIKWWQPAVTIGCNPQWLTLEGQKYRKPILEYAFDNMLRLPEDILITVNLSGRSSGHMHTQLLRSDPFTLDLGISKSLINRQLDIKLAVKDLFNTSREGWRLDNGGIDMTKTVSYDNRHIALTVTYTFQPRKSAWRGGEASEAEASRL